MPPLFVGLFQTVDRILQPPWRFDVAVQDGLVYRPSRGLSMVTDHRLQICLARRSMLICSPGDIPGCSGLHRVAGDSRGERIWARAGSIRSPKGNWSMRGAEKRGRNGAEYHVAEPRGVCRQDCCQRAQVAAFGGRASGDGGPDAGLHDGPDVAGHQPCRGPVAGIPCIDAGSRCGCFGGSRPAGGKALNASRRSFDGWLPIVQA
jgi:hypothetical protein